MNCNFNTYLHTQQVYLPFIIVLLNFIYNAERKNNFPPLPEKCCVQPCFYQDFEVDIPLEFQRIVKIMYYVWICKYT